MKEKIKSLLKSNKLPFVLVFISFLLFSPALFIDWQMDDHFHRLHFADGELMPDVKHNPWDMFTFMKGEQEHEFQMMDFGTLPWWTAEGIRARFWRPLTVLTHMLDYQLWPNNPVLMHLHSLLWYMTIVLIICFFLSPIYRSWLDCRFGCLFICNRSSPWLACSLDRQ